MAIEHKKAIGVYHWDTFDNETILLKDCNTLEEAHQFIKEHYGDRIRLTGADRVDIVNRNGTVLERFNVV